MSVSIALAFVAGLLSFVSPCVLALVPVYVAFLGDTASAAAPAGAPGAATSTRVAPGSASVLPQALLFIAGFTLVFVLVGASFGLIGQTLFRDPLSRQVAGGIVIVIGVLTTGIFGPFLERLSLPLSTAALPQARAARSLALGGLVAVGWTPCIGPVLGAILTMGLSAADAPAAVVLLLAYSAGLAVPFVLAAMALPRIRPALTFLRRHHAAVRITSGIFIILIGLLIFTNAFARLATIFTIAI